MVIFLPSVLHCILVCGPSPNARPQDKIKQQVKKLQYPIQKPDICRIQKSLGAVKETLDLALQNLELCLATSKLSNLEAASQQASSSLAALDSNISTLQTKLDDLLDRFQQNDTAVAVALDEEDPRIAIYKLAYKPSNLAALCASLESTTNVLRAASTAETSSCPCRRQIIRRTNRVSWLPWDFWDSETLRFEHYKGCKYFRSNGDERSRVRVLRITGFVKNAVIITLYTSTGAGGQSLGANLEYRATVDRMVSPAFRVMSVLEECADMLYHKLEVQQIKNQAQWERLTLSASHKLEYLFRLGKASAKDVDSRNQTLLHAAAEVASWIYIIMDWDRESGEAYSLPVIHLATHLVKRQASASLLDLDGQQALAIATPREPLSGPLIEAFYTCDADIHESDLSHLINHLEPQKLAQTFSSFATMLRVADAFHGPLSMAVISNDRVQLCRLLWTHPEGFGERAYYSGRTPLHLAVGYPECLQILVERSNPSHLVQKDNDYYTVLGYAILLSKALCGQRENQDGSSCRCTLPLRILLEGGCPIIPRRDFMSGTVGEVIASASKHCKIYLAKSVLQRRQKLKLIAQQYLSPLEIDRFKLNRPVTLDIYAIQVDKLLRERGFIEFGPLATYVKDDRFGFESPPIHDNRSIYHDLSTAEDANIYSDLWFSDITAYLHIPMSISPGFYINLPFAKWLLDHDAPLCEWMHHWGSPWTGYIADAFVLAHFGAKRPASRRARGGDEKLVRELEERMLMDDSVDSCFCRCSIRGCTPFVVRLKRMRLTDDTIGIATTYTTYLKEYGNALRREHHYAAIRSITFDALGIAHTCMCRKKFNINPELDAEEIAEIQDEYADLLELLESLIEEFETHAFETFDKATDGLDSMITFWNGHWVRRMSEIHSELSRAGEANKTAAEDVGVVWEPQPERETHEWKGWDYYFQQIEEIE
ncbi:hypothetical protein M431DRAFT_517204 [Trichoderma harzianum CBS 226.95]|uniref:Uncharacterized protein n=1 Tax=Trichoderma harzianum CBS 226.95 TaxID=983964 RepID=A0A2T4AKF6_TRIHA|nr:hypothetical protein M431DRAFT_517204 [Trichoderma harzianum CBS 226.95]PTB57555.1 hypothetical protein M431DRAFT_517204 [Trichoderma harzianum CBS 226.95]